MHRSAHTKYDIIILNERFKGRLLRQSLFFMISQLKRLHET
nr:MAG TPA: hypothetical protein [Caudoviricetes sp.]